MVLDDRVSWDAPFSDYSPVHYTAGVVASRPRPPWADPDFEYVSSMLCYKVGALVKKLVETKYFRIRLWLVRILKSVFFFYVFMPLSLGSVGEGIMFYGSPLSALFVRLSEQILLPQYLVNGLRNLDSG